MPLSSIVTNFYYTTEHPAISAELSELLEGVASTGISAELSELLDSIPTQGISAELQDRIPELLILLGVDTTTGRYKEFNPGDNLVRSNGVAYLGSTGLRGPTGLRGATGMNEQGLTGLLTGNTGIQGRTGIALNGRTGLQGDTGLVGLTGLQPVQGATGVSPTGLAGILGSQVPGTTGLRGLTGLAGITGFFSPTGLAGLQGNTGFTNNALFGSTGLVGFAPAGPSPQGETGIVAGGTGLSGITGSVGIGGMETVFSLNASNSLVASSLSYTVPANTLTINEQQLEILTWGVSSTSGAATTVSLTFGGATLLSQIVSGAAGSPFYVRSLIIRVAATTQENNSYLISRDGETFGQRTTTSVDFTTDQTLQVSATTATLDGQQFIFGLLVRKVTQI